jgi:hypothetical protein
MLYTLHTQYGGLGFLLIVSVFSYFITLAAIEGLNYFLERKARE